MRLFIYLIFNILLLGNCAPSLASSDAEIIIDFCKAENKCGYMDINGKILIAPIYQAVDPFNNGLAWVRKDGHWGAINSDGEFAVLPQYDSVRAFTENGYARVYLHRKWGVIDRHGEVVIPLSYFNLGNFVDGLAWFEDGNTGEIGLINAKGEIIVKPIYDYIGSLKYPPIEVKYGEKFGYIDRTGKAVTPIIYDRIQSFIGEYARVGMQADEHGLAYNFGYINRVGETIMPIEHERLPKLLEGETIVTLKGDDGYSIFDLADKGRKLCTANYDYVGLESNNMALIRQQGKFGLIDLNCKELIPPTYSNTLFIYDDIITFRDEGGYSGYLDKSGKEIFRVKYRSVGHFSEGLAWVKKNGKMGFINEDKKLVIPLKYNTGYGFHNGLAVVWRNNNKKAYYITKDGREIGPIKTPIGVGEKYTPIYLCDGKRYAMDSNGNLIGFKKSEFKKCAK